MSIQSEVHATAAVGPHGGGASQRCAASIASLTEGELSRLAERVNAFEDAEHDFVQCELQRLRELALLNRMADAMGGARSLETIIADALRETRRVTNNANVWFIETHADRVLGAVYGPVGRVSPEHLPQELCDLTEQLAARPELEVMHLPAYFAEDGDRVYIGVAAASSSHVHGVLAAAINPEHHAAESPVIRMLQTLARQAAIACENALLMESMSQLSIEVVLAMAVAIESRDPYTGGHVLRVTEYALLLGEQLGLAPRQRAMLRLGGVLHDIGKVGVPDAVLRKPGRLTDEEFAVMRRHPVIGHEIIQSIPPLLELIPIVRHHHERWDGRGYPDSLAGEQTPLLARITALADAFDAMTSDRPYRPGMSIAEAIEEIRRCAGAQFDPQLAASFTSISPERLASAAARGLRGMDAIKADSKAQLLAMVELNRPRIAEAGSDR